MEEVDKPIDTSLTVARSARPTSQDRSYRCERKIAVEVHHCPAPELDASTNWDLFELLLNQ